MSMHIACVHLLFVKTIILTDPAVCLAEELWVGGILEGEQADKPLV